MATGAKEICLHITEGQIQPIRSKQHCGGKLLLQGPAHPHVVMAGKLHRRIQWGRYTQCYKYGDTSQPQSNISRTRRLKTNRRMNQTTHPQKTHSEEKTTLFRDCCRGDSNPAAPTYSVTTNMKRSSRNITTTTMTNVTQNRKKEFIFTTNQMDSHRKSDFVHIDIQTTVLT